MSSAAPSTGLTEGAASDRLRGAVTLYIFAVLGVFLLSVPWTPIWERATLVLAPTPLGSLVRSGWLRGVVSGLGCLDLVVAARTGLDLWNVVRLEARRGDGR